VREEDLSSISVVILRWSVWSMQGVLGRKAMLIEEGVTRSLHLCRSLRPPVVLIVFLLRARHGIQHPSIRCRNGVPYRRALTGQARD
jgi:hypothetical protein